MSIEVLLDLIRRQFSPSEGQTLVLSLQQDPLLWQFIKDEENSITYFASAPRTLDSYSPGRIAAWSIQQETGTDFNDPQDLESPLPKELKQRAAQVFETTFNTGLPPTDLLTAGLLALTLRERRIIKGGWQGVSDEIFIKRSKTDLQKNYYIWRTPFACLYTLCPDFDDLMMDFLGAESEAVISAFIPVFIHALLANPIDSKTQLERLSAIVKVLDIDPQLEILKWLEAFNKSELRTSLAKHLLQSKRNVDFFASVFSELEALESRGTTSDPLTQKVRYTLAEDLNRIAAFNYFSGNPQQAKAYYQKSSELLDYIKSQTFYQSLASDPDSPSQSDWSELIKALPDSEQSHLLEIHALIEQEKYDEAAERLNESQNSIGKVLLENKINEIKNADSVAAKTVKQSARSNSDQLFQSTGYYVRPSTSGGTRDLIKTLQETNDLDESLNIADAYIERNAYDPHIIQSIRDVYEKVHQYDKAITLTSYLNLVEPEKTQHIRKLARLYVQAERWQDAFSTFQGIIKAEPSPRTEDLVHLAKSAMKTDHVDMAISICQNVLSRESNNTKALVILGESYMLKGDPIKAIQHMEQVVEMIPDEPETWLTLARLWEDNDQADRAFEILNKGILALPQDPQLLHALGKAHLERLAPSDARTCLRKAHEIEPEKAAINLDLAQAEYQLGHYEAARKLLEPFMNSYEQDPTVAKFLGLVLLGMEEKQSAEPILLFAAKAFPEEADSVLTGVRLAFERIEATHEEAAPEELEELNTLLKTALTYHPNDARVRLHQADITRFSGEYQQAFDEYLALSEKDQSRNITTDWRFSYGLGRTAVALENYEIGLAALQEANSKQPENLFILQALAEAYQLASLDEKAQQTTRSALKMAPQDIQNILWYADFKMKNNEPQESVKALEEALQITPDRSDLKFWLAKSLYASGDFQKTQEYIRELISASESTPEQLHQTAYLCVQINELDLAVQALEKAGQIISEENPTLLMDLAICHALLGHRKKALEVLNLNRDVGIKYPELSMLKSDLLCDLGQYTLAFNTLKVVEEYIEDIFNATGVDPDEKKHSPLLYRYDFTQKGYHYRMGQLLRALGEIKGSQTQLSQALELDPEDIQIGNACVEAYAAGMDFTNALPIIECINTTELKHKVQAHRDLSCTQAEILLMQDKVEEAKSLFEDQMSDDAAYPRALAIRSKLAFAKGDVVSAHDYYGQAYDAYTKDWREEHNHSLHTVFQHAMILTALAQVAANLEEYPQALDFHTKAAALTADQPWQDWLHAKTLMKAAQAQQIARLLSIKAHAPGEEMLSEKQYELCQTLLEKSSPYLSDQEMVCAKAQCVASFIGKCPISLNIKACLTTPEEAALVMMNCDDEELVQDIIDSYPDDSHILQAYGLHALRSNTNDGAAHVEKALQMDVSNPVNHALLALLNRDDPELAVKSLETALEFWHEEPEWHALAGELYNQIGDTDSASKHIAAALESQPDNAAYWQRSAEIKLKGNELQEAKDDLEKSAALQSEDAYIWVKMAHVNRRLGNMPEALQNMKKAGALAPEDKEVALQEINYLIEQDQLVDAENKAKEWLGKEKKDHEGQILLARARAKQGKFDLALEGLEKFDDQKALLEKIRIRKERDGAENVLPDLIALAQDNAEDPDILTTLTDYLIQTNRLKEAEEAAQTILRVVPEQAKVHLMLGRLQRKTGQLDQAITHLSDAIQYDPSLMEAYLELGKTYQERRDLENAIKVFQKGCKANSSDPRPYYHAGMALKDCKDYAGAEAMLKEAKKHAPGDPLIIRQLGVVTALNLVNNLRETR